MKFWTKKFVALVSSLLPIFLLNSQAFSAQNSVDRGPLYLEVGEQRSLEFPELLRFSVSGDAIRYTRLRENNRILLKAIKPGMAQLEVIEGPSAARSTLSTRLIRVEQRRIAPGSDQLLRAISRLQDLEVIDAGKRFVIRGTIAHYKDAVLVAELRDRFPDDILDETEIAPAWMESLRPRLAGVVAHYPHLRLDLQESGVYVRGSVAHVEMQKNLERQIRALQPLARFDLQTIQVENATLYFKIYLLEMKRSTLRNFGVQWPTSHPLTLQVGTFDQGWSLSGPTQIDLSVQAASQKGELKILSSPELVVRCPGQAELFAGGELPIRNRSKNHSEVVWKNVGLSLRLDTKEYSGEKIRLNVETELSHLDMEGAFNNDEIPGVKSNRLKTQVDATMGKPLFLSGLLQENWLKNVKGILGLADIPILGALFSSEDFRNDRSELVAILVPSRDPPEQPVTRLRSGLPRGFLPLPRAPLSALEIEELKSSSDYPWNALE